MTAAQRRLLNQARRARARAFAPFSRFSVGAAVEARAGRAYTGANVESASYGLTCCAERVAIFKAVTAGERAFKRLAVVTDTDRLTPPCGACRQIIWEFCGDIEIILANLKGQAAVHRMRTLLPRPFDASLL
ncbi:MAG: cytidine deaminase [Acidobacteria bacterium]|nr:cytidine deaminase [Acidobacteriota bacterium]